MKMKGGYTPKISGRPSNILHKIPISSYLNINLYRNGYLYRPIVKNGVAVKMGDVIAECNVNNLSLYMPSPADGIIELIQDAGKSVSIKITDIDPAIEVHEELIKDPSRLTPGNAVQMLQENGIWNYIWSTGTRGMPVFSNEQKPKAIIINSIISEPFKTRGKVILKHFWQSIIKGISYLNILLSDYGTIEFILTEKRDPIVKQMLEELKGKTNLKFHFTEVKYPVEHNLIIEELLKRSNSQFSEEDDLWLLNIQSVEAIGNCLGNGISNNRRIIALGGPALPDPKHINVRIGTPLSHIIPETLDLSHILILRGGLFLGNAVDPENVFIDFDDNAFFFLPIKKIRDFVTFIKPGFNKKSIFPSFAGRIDKDLSNHLRGEERPCIACGKCQEICPVDLMPQILHRYLYRERLDEAQSLGLDKCIGCNLCTFVCPSKIELKLQFDVAIQKLKSEKEASL